MRHPIRLPAIALLAATASPAAHAGSCFTVLSESVVCHADGSAFTYTVTGLDDCTGAESTYTFTGSGGAPGEELCFTLLINGAGGGLCCTEQRCVTVPDCTLDVDIFAVSFFGDAYRIDPLTGTGVAVGPTGFVELNALARDGQGTIYATGNLSGPSSLITIDPRTGAGTFVMNLGLQDIRAMAFSPFDQLYVIVNGGSVVTPDLLYIVDVQSGLFELIGQTSHFSGVQALEFAQDGTLYGWDVAPGGGLLLIDTSTGAATDVNDAVDSIGGLQTLAFSPDESQLFGAQDELYRVDPQTAVQGLVGSGGYVDIRGMTFLDAPASVPGDVDGDGFVNTFDLLALLESWGACPGLPDPCPADLDEDGGVGASDLLLLLAAWP